MQSRTRPSATRQRCRRRTAPTHTTHWLSVLRSEWLQRQQLHHRGPESICERVLPGNTTSPQPRHTRRSWLGVGRPSPQDPRARPLPVLSRTHLPQRDHLNLPHAVAMSLLSCRCCHVAAVVMSRCQLPQMTQMLQGPLMRQDQWWHLQELPTAPHCPPLPPLPPLLDSPARLAAAAAASIASIQLSQSVAEAAWSL